MGLFNFTPGKSIGGNIGGQVGNILLPELGGLGGVVGSFLGSFIGGLFGGGFGNHTSSAARRARLMAAFADTANTKNAFNINRVRQSEVTDQGQELDFISGKNRYHQGEDIFWQAYSVLITVGNPNGLWDIEHRSVNELLKNLDTVQLGEPGGVFLVSPLISASAIESMYGYLLEFNPQKAAQFKAATIAHPLFGRWDNMPPLQWEHIEFIHDNPEYGNAIKDEIALRREEKDITSQDFRNRTTTDFNISQVVRNEFNSRRDDIMEVISSRDLSLDEIEHANQIREIFNRTLFIPSAELQAQIDHRERLMDKALEVRISADNSMGLWQEAADAITETIQNKLQELTGLSAEISNADVLDIRHMNEQLESQARLNLEVEASELERDFLVDSTANLQIQTEQVARTLNDIDALSITDQLTETQEALEGFSQQLQEQIESYNQSHITLQDEFEGVINEFDAQIPEIIGDGLNFDNLNFLTLGVTMGKRLLDEAREDGSVDDVEYEQRLNELNQRQVEIDNRINEGQAEREIIADRVVEGLDIVGDQLTQLKSKLPDLELPEPTPPLLGEPNLPTLDPVGISLGQSLAQPQAPVVQQEQPPDVGEFLGEPEVKPIIGHLTKASTIGDLLQQKNKEKQDISNIFG